MKQLTGILLIAISAASFGTLAIFGRFLYQDGLDTFTMLFLRFGLAALLMMVILFIRKEKFPRGKILLQLIGMGAVGYVGQSFPISLPSSTHLPGWLPCCSICTPCSCSSFR